MANNSGNGAIVGAAFILGAAIVASSLILQSSVDRTSEDLKAVLVAMNEARPSAAPAAARPGRPDPTRIYSVKIGDAPRKGGENAKVSIVEFSDFQCPYCSRVTPTLKQIEKEYGSQVQIAFKHLPLSMHAKAPAAHAAAQAAHEQGKFWEMHDLIFANQKEMSPEKYEQYAAEMGLDLARFKKDVASPSIKKKVEADSAEAASLGITGTPAFLVNGRYLSGAQPFANFKRVIDEELAKKS